MRSVGQLPDNWRQVVADAEQVAEKMTQAELADFTSRLDPAIPSLDHPGVSLARIVGGLSLNCARAAWMILADESELGDVARGKLREVAAHWAGGFPAGRRAAVLDAVIAEVVEQSKPRPEDDFGRDDSRNHLGQG